MTMYLFIDVLIIRYLHEKGKFSVQTKSLNAGMPFSYIFIYNIYIIYIHII